ncbi:MULTISPECIES: NADH-quinone oxidoreductase subunit J [Acidiplasma]|jgi:NADH:ubiquinone oxidoreductase subunit 6 (subunit J)|uniref:NADH dehydrogenase n=2 Tax=Acidiplasma TaxID=507753 RepID=A0A0Q0XJG9_9ARCH|nr:MULTISPECIES: NADH-quinone oxidoreductase subunit J [Acidiplasma]KJE50083.1 NADH dehydrogenase [Acidiplasma sp. MBA-1]KPV45960.1 NADH dehydrogenase [Acidiplasma aeolicum]KQB34173.1 NADH dehydrogenase [Acidiplasma aeolicum]KQB35053.1 NADH dehydrogenase [Acidiplasma cupricumulans]WMT55651.1 MAG: short chain dehydrogenase [Acidiplasma sp.]
MKNKLQKIAVSVFFIIFAANILFIRASFIPRTQNLFNIGKLLFSAYLVPFELLSVILVASIIGVMFIAGEVK